MSDIVPAADAEVCSEFSRYDQPFIQVRRWQGRTAFAKTDFEVGDVVLEEPPLIWFYEDSDNNSESPGVPGCTVVNGPGGDPQQDRVGATVRGKCSEVLSKFGPDESLVSAGFFSPLFCLNWTRLTRADVKDVLELFYYSSASTAGEACGDEGAATGACGGKNEKAIILERIEAGQSACDKIYAHLPKEGGELFANGEEIFAFLKAFDINIHKDEEKVAGLFVIASKFSHSCEANCAWSFRQEGGSEGCEVRARLEWIP